MHLLFNIAGAVIFGTAAFILFVLRPSLAVHNITSVEISLFHTFFNIICTTIMMPFGGLLVKLSGMKKMPHLRQATAMRLSFQDILITEY